MRFSAKQKVTLGMKMDEEIERYLIACKNHDGALKAHWHIELCKIVVATIQDVDPDNVFIGDDKTLFARIHTETKELTDYLDDQIGFPFDRDPDYGRLIPRFFDKFLALAEEAVQ